MRQMSLCVCTRTVSQVVVVIEPSGGARGLNTGRCGCVGRLGQQHLRTWLDGSSAAVRAGVAADRGTFLNTREAEQRRSLVLHDRDRRTEAAEARPFASANPL